MPAKKKVAKSQLTHKNEKSKGKKNVVAAKPKINVVSKVKPVKKTTPSKKTVIKKVTPAKKAVSAKKVSAKKAIVKKGNDVKATKKVVNKKQESKTKIVTKKTTSVKKIAPTKMKTEKKQIKTPVKKDIVISMRPLSKPAAQKKSVSPSKQKKIDMELHEKVYKMPAKPKVRYPEEDLKMFHDRIVDMRKEAIEELRMLRERLEDLTNYDFAEESMIYSMHMAEQGSEAFEKEKTYAQIQRINEYIKKLDEALSRIKDKTFGICRVCGCLIAKERLLAVPITTLSASYKIQKRCPEDGIDRIEPLKE